MLTCEDTRSGYTLSAACDKRRDLRLLREYNRSMFDVLTSKSGMSGSINSCHSLRGMTSTGTSWVTTRLTLDRVGWKRKREDGYL